MKAARDRGEDLYNPVRKDHIFGKTQTRQDLWKGHLKDPVEALDNTLNYLENEY